MASGEALTEWAEEAEFVCCVGLVMSCLVCYIVLHCTGRSGGLIWFGLVGVGVVT